MTENIGLKKENIHWYLNKNMKLFEQEYEIQEYEKEKDEYSSDIVPK